MKVPCLSRGNHMLLTDLEVDPFRKDVDPTLRTMDISLLPLNPLVKADLHRWYCVINIPSIR